MGRLPNAARAALLLASVLVPGLASAQKVTGTPGSPSATTTSRATSFHRLRGSSGA